MNIIHVGRFDELATVIDKVVTHDATTLYLVLAPDAGIAQNFFNFQLLKQQADSVGKEIIVVSEDVRIRGIASKAAFAVTSSIDIAEETVENSFDKTTVFQIRTAVAGNSSRRPIMDIIPPKGVPKSPTISKKALKIKRFVPGKREDGFEQIKKSKDRTSSVEYFLSSTRTASHHKRRPFFSLRLPSLRAVARPLGASAAFMGGNAVKIFLILGGVSAVVVFMFVALQVLPRVTISVTPRSMEDTINFELVVDSNVSSADFERGVIPGQILEEKEERKFTFSASGSVDVDNYAEGSIRVFNEFSSSAQTLVANTRFLSAEGKLFRMVETIVVPGATIEGGKIIASSTFVQVRAAESGDNYNIGPTTFSIPGFKGTEKYLAFYGKNESSMEGGYQGVRAVITAEDIENAREKIENEFVPIIEGRLRNKIPDHLFVLEESFDSDLEELDFSADEGGFEDFFTVRAVARARTFLLEEADVENAVEYQFRNSSQYSKKFELAQTQNIEYVIKEVNYAKGVVSVSLNVKQLFSRSINANTLLAEVLGKSEIEVRQILSSKEELEKAQVRFWPFWVKSVPFDEADVTIEIFKK